MEFCSKCNRLDYLTKCLDSNLCKRCYNQWSTQSSEELSEIQEKLKLYKKRIGKKNINELLRNYKIIMLFFE